jgi:hypothetical protein
MDTFIGIDFDDDILETLSSEIITQQDNEHILKLLGEFFGYELDEDELPDETDLTMDIDDMIEKGNSLETFLTLYNHVLTESRR